MVLVQRRRDGDEALVVTHLWNLREGEADRAHRLCLTHVDALDPGVGVGAGEDAPVQHSRQADVDRVALLTGHDGDAVFAGGYLPHYVEPRLFHSPTLLAAGTSIA